MISMPPHDFIERSDTIRHCRRHQLEQLGLYYNHYLPCPPVLVAHGLRNSGKLDTILTLLAATHLDHVLVRSRECLSQRHLLAKIFSACIRALKQEDRVDKFDRIDSLNALSVNLQKLFQNATGKFVLIIDGIDRQRAASATLLPSLARLADLVPTLSIILTTSSPRQLHLQKPGVPYVRFSTYTRDDSIRMALAKMPPLLPSSITDYFYDAGNYEQRADSDSTDMYASKVKLQTPSDAALISIYTSFVHAVYDTLIVHTSSTSQPAFEKACETLWPRFIWPMLSGETVPSRSRQQSSTKLKWDFARLLARSRPLFQKSGENALLNKLTTTNELWTFSDLLEDHKLKQKTSNTIHPPDRTSSPSQSAAPTLSIPLLKFFPSLLLLSSYLASHTPPKHDIILFSRLSSSSSHKRRYLSSALNRNRIPKKRRKTRTDTDGTTIDNENGVNTDTPSKKLDRQIAIAEAKGTPLEKEKTHKSSRLQFEKTSSIPKPFSLERVTAIVRAVHPDGLPRTRGAADIVYAEMVELERLRMVIRLGTGANPGAGANINAGIEGPGHKGTDDGILEEKWRINVSKQFVIDIAKQWDMGLEGWEID